MPSEATAAVPAVSDLQRRFAETRKLLEILFDPHDYVSIRPIETWVEAGRKRSRVLFKYARGWRLETFTETRFAEYLRLAAAEHANLFFGTCPRQGSDGFELAWQIRRVTCLWADLDHCTPAEALERCAKAGLPVPTIVVCSGNGAHLYWKLVEPVLIDDVPVPPMVQNEWIRKVGGGKKPRKYVTVDGERIYLDQRPHLARLSAKAQRIQDNLAGVAKAIGGDHTTDLSRLLRLPGSPNRKDERNGQEPRESTLVEVDASRMYSLSAFESFAAASPDTQHRKQIESMPLPRPRKVSQSKADKLAEMIAACAIAQNGSRSQADFALCCFALRQAVDKEDVWRDAEGVGKFAERGRSYFDLTWESAEYDVRVTTFNKIQRRMLPQPAIPQRPSPADTSDMPTPDGELVIQGDPVDGDEPDEEDTGVIRVDPQVMPVAKTMSEVSSRLIRSGECYTRTDQLVVVHQETITPVLGSAELAGLLNHYVEFYFVDEEGGEYKPLPAAYGNTWLNHPAERHKLPRINLFTRNPVFTSDWRLASPGFDPPSGIYYAGPSIDVRQGTEHLDRLLADFCFKSIADRTNYIGMLLTALLVPRFIGSKPAVLFNGNQPELGKSILAQIIAILRDGHVVETATYNPNDEEFEKRLGAIVRRGTTTIIIDNAKARGRSPRIDSACLERSITDAILSFRLLGFSQDIRAENSHIFCITANSAEVSRDLVTRSVAINLYHEGNPERRVFTIVDPEGYAETHRLELLGELIGMVERWKAAGMPMAAVDTRFNKRDWGRIIGGILSACGEPDFLANAEEAAEQLDGTRREFSELVAILAEHQQGTWTGTELTGLALGQRLLKAELGEDSARSQATRMGVLAGRFVQEQFVLADGRTAVFQRSEERKGKVYRVHFL